MKFEVITNAQMKISAGAIPAIARRAITAELKGVAWQTTKADLKMSIATRNRDLWK